MLGETISHYEILDVVGRGGMGVVYKARDTKLNRFVALKFLPPEVTDDDRARARFIQEAQAASALEHPNICVIHEIDETADGQLFMAMAYYPGESLKQRVSRSVMSIPEAARIGAQIAQGLAKAHQRSIIHRDIKPANILITEDGHVKIVDFGVAKLSDRTGLTREGGVVGTVAYMSPEQVRGDEVDHRTDLWSIGVVLHELLTGRLPFRGGHEQALVFSILKEEPDLHHLERLGDPAMARVIKRCLEKSLQRRWESADQLGTAVRAILAGESSDHETDAPSGEDDETALLITSPALYTPAAPDFSDMPLDHEGFVGRGAEIARLSEFLDAALAGKGQIALITGEAGQGKTSLVRELCRRAEENHPNLVIGSGKCNAQTGTVDPYHPFREVLGLLSGDFQLKGATSFLTRESAERLWKRMPSTVDALIELGPDLIDTFIPARPLLSRSRPSAPSGTPWLDRLRQRIETSSGERQVRPEQGALFDQYSRVLQTLAQQGPLVVLLEDLHWADPGSIELLAHLGESLSRSPTLILGTFRREDLATGTDGDRHPLEPLVNDLKRSFGDIEIDLDRSGGREFIEALLDSQPNRLDSTFREALYRQTGGLPLFTVELLSEMQDQGFLLEDEDGCLIEGPTLDWEMVPARAEAVVAERIERLPADLQTLLTTCSVEGEEFTAEVVAQVQNLDERETAKLLSSEIAKKHGLVAALSVGRIEGRRITRYRFRHILFQRYLYGRLDEVERSFLHEEVGHRLEEIYGERVGDVAVQLAKHFELAGIAEKTIDYLRQAALSAARLSANLEVIENLQTALEQLESLTANEARDRLELEIRTTLTPALIAVKGFTAAEVAATNLRSQELCEKLPDAASFDMLWGLFTFDSVGADFVKSLPISEQLVHVADPKSPIQQLQAHYARGISGFFLGDLEAATGWLAKVTAVDEPGLGEQLSLIFAQDSRKVAMSFESLIAWLRGDAEQAAARAAEAIAWARQDAHPFTLTTVLLVTSFTHLCLRQTEQVAESGQEILSLSEEYSLFQTREANIVLGLARAFSEQGRDVESLRQGIDEYRDSGARVFLPFYLAHLAEACLDRGEPNDAPSLLAEALDISATGGDRFWEAEIHRLQGQVASAAGEGSAADNLRQAVSIAQRQNARALERRAQAQLDQLTS